MYERHPNLVEAKSISASDSAALFKEFSYIRKNHINNYYKTWSFILLKKYPLSVMKKSLKQISWVLLNPKVFFIGTASHDYFYEECTHPGTPEIQYMIQNLNYDNNIQGNIYYSNILALGINNMSLIMRYLFFVMLFYLIIVAVKQKNMFLLSVWLLFVGTLITIATVHTFDLTRYVQSLFPLITSILLFALFNILQIIEKSRKKH